MRKTQSQGHKEHLLPVTQLPKNHSIKNLVFYIRTSHRRHGEAAAGDKDRDHAGSIG